jgi:hypothetical protein
MIDFGELKGRFRFFGSTKLSSRHLTVRHLGVQANRSPHSPLSDGSSPKAFISGTSPTWCSRPMSCGSAVSGSNGSSTRAFVRHVRPSERRGGCSRWGGRVGPYGDLL